MMIFPKSKNADVLFGKIKVLNKTLNNRIVFQPMEGCDGTVDGRPDKLTKERYKRFAEAGPGLIWLEATAVSNEGRANPRQLYINKDNIQDFARLAESIKSDCLKANGFEPVVIIQLTHSGRYSKPVKFPEPIIAYNNPLFEKDTPIDKSRIVSDDYLKIAEDSLAAGAVLAEKAGFDGADIKCCHRYLASELCSAYMRKGEYGGIFENRTRFIINSVSKAKASADKDFIITSRINLYDGFEYPYGFGVNEGKGKEPDFSEGVKLAQKLDLPLINITLGNPYVNPQVNRPCKDNESYQNAVLLLLKAAQAVRQNIAGEVVCSGLSALGTDAPIIAAGAIEQGFCSLAGFGRFAFAYPDFIKDIKNGLNPKKICITCGKCSYLMRMGGTSGCVIRNTYYLNHYKELTKNG